MDPKLHYIIKLYRMGVSVISSLRFGSSKHVSGMFLVQFETKSLEDQWNCHKILSCFTVLLRQKDTNTTQASKKKNSKKKYGQNAVSEESIQKP